MTRLYLFAPDPLPAGAAAWRWRAADAAGAAPLAGLPPADEVWLVLPAARVLLTSLELPPRALRRLGGALAFALEDRLMLDPATAHVALAPAAGQGARPAAVVERAWLGELLHLCRQAGLDPAGALPETLMWAAPDGGWHGRWNGAAGFVRTGRCAGFALDDGGPDAPPLALTLALAQARRSDSAPAGLWLEADGLDADAWSARLGLPVIRQALLPEAGASAINLLQGDFAPRRQGPRLGAWRLAAGLAGAALLVQFIATGADWARLAWEKRQLRAELRRVFQEAFPQAATIVDPTLQMRRQLAELRVAHGLAEPGDLLHALAGAADGLAGVGGLRYEAGRLTLVGPRADGAGLAAALARQGHALEQAGAEWRIGMPRP